MQTIQATDISAAVGIIRPEVNWFALEMSAWWNASKDSGVAVILHPTVCVDFLNDTVTKPVPSHYTAEEWQRLKVEGQRKENERRDRATLEVCALVLMAYVEGRYNYARQQAKIRGDDYLLETLAADQSAPSYTEMREFLMGELDAHPVIAATAAFHAMRYCGRKRVSAVYEAWTNDKPIDEGRCWL